MYIYIYVIYIYIYKHTYIHTYIFIYVSFPFCPVHADLYRLPIRPTVLSACQADLSWLPVLAVLSLFGVTVVLSQLSCLCCHLWPSYPS